MKKLFLILYGILMVITAIASVYLYTHQTPTPTAQSPANTIQKPGPLYAYSANGERGPLLEPAKEALSIDQSSGDMVLTEKPEYILEFFPGDNTFNITLLNTNLRASRLAAEQDLLTRFRLTEEQACSLNVMVGTIASVSQQFSGQQLGLSFCAGRVDLPTTVDDPLTPGASTSIQPDTAL